MMLRTVPTLVALFLFIALVEKTTTGRADGSPAPRGSQRSSRGEECYQPYVDVAKRFTHAVTDGREVVDRLDGFLKADGKTSQPFFTLRFVGYDRGVYRYNCRRGSTETGPVEAVAIADGTFHNTYPDNLYYPPLRWARRESRTVKYENVTVGRGVTREAIKMESLFVWEGYFASGKSYGRDKKFSYDQYGVENGVVEVFAETGRPFNPVGVSTVYRFQTKWRGQGDRQRMVEIEFLGSEKAIK